MSTRACVLRLKGRVLTEAWWGRCLQCVALFLLQRQRWRLLGFCNGAAQSQFLWSVDRAS